MQKTRFISELRVGDEVAAPFLLGSAQQGQAKNGPFWKLELRDRSGSLEAKIWSPQSQNYKDLQAGDIVKITGRINMYRERLEIAVENLAALTDDEKAVLDFSLFRSASERSGADMLAELELLHKRTLTYKPWKKLLKLIFSDPRITEYLLTAPAAKTLHHAYAGGLLEHILGVSKLCMAFADLYPDLDRQILLVAATCHDLGKLWELGQGLTTEYTEEGRLMGHIQLMLDFLEPLLRKAGLPGHLGLHCKHLILSHHGQYEFGSPRLPATGEAFALHYADILDARLNLTKGALNGVAKGESGWSSYLPSLERNVYRPLPTPADDPQKALPSPDRAQGNAEAGADDEAAYSPCQFSLI
ncbi:HDIG domain-containing protein [Deltaproteobacteria bacterium]|nr:HDIG domain-containing protein [Deltaproteobacteria bacterium]